MSPIEFRVLPLRVEPLPLNPEIAEAHSAWIPVAGGNYSQCPAQPHSIGDIDGDGRLDFTVCEVAQEESGIRIEIHEGESSEVLRTHSDSPGNRQLILRGFDGPQSPYVRSLL